MRSKKNNWLDEFAMDQAEKQSTTSMKKTAAAVAVELPMNALIVDPVDFPNVKQGSIIRLDQDYVVVNASYEDEMGAGLVIVPEKKVAAKDLRKNRLSKEAGGAQEYNRVDPGNVYDLNPPSDQVDQQRWEQSARETETVIQQETAKGPRDTVQRHYERPVTDPGGMGMGMGMGMPSVAPEDMVSDIENFDAPVEKVAPETDVEEEVEEEEFAPETGVEEEVEEEALPEDDKVEDEVLDDEDDEDEEDKKLPVNHIMARIRASRKSAK